MAKTLKRAIAVLMSVLMIATALPFAAITAMAADKVTINFTANKYATGYTDNTDGGVFYNIWGRDGNAEAKDGTLYLNGGVIFINDDRAKSYIQNNEFSFEFSAKYKGNGNFALATVARADIDYIRLNTNGDFFVNGERKTNISLPVSFWNDYAFSYDGSTVKLFVNGEEKYSTPATLNITPDGKALYPSLGWSDMCGTNSIDSAEYGYATVSNAQYNSADYVANKLNSVITADLANNAKAESFNAAAYHAWDVANGGYSNVVYHRSDSTSWNNDYVSIRGFGVKIAIPNNIVLAYDGVNSVREPVVLETKSTNGSNNNNHIIKTAFLTNRTLMSFGDKIGDVETPAYSTGYWRGDHNLDYRAYRYNDTADSYKIGYAPFCDYDSPYQNNSNNARFWYNTLSYVGSGNTDSYYDHITEQEWDIYSRSRNDGFTDNYLKTYTNTYILNYKPVYDILSNADFKTLYNKVYAHQSEYTADSLKAYLLAVYKIASINVNGAFENIQTNSVEYTARSVAAQIKDATNSYNDAVANLQCAHINTTDTDSNVVAANCVDKGSKTVTTTCNYCKEVLNVQNNVEISVDAENHKGPEVKGDVVAPTASKDGFTGNTYCDACKTMIREDGETDPATGNYSAYNAAVVSANAELDNADIYVSVAGLESALAEAKTKAENATTQKDIDDAVTMIESAINSLVKKGYTVNVSIQKNGVEVATDTASVSAGDVYTYTATGESIYKVVYNDKKILSDNNEFSVVVTKDMDITVYLADDVADDTKVKATFKAANGVIVAIQYYESKAYINVSNVAAPAIPFYNFDQWARVTDSDKNVVFEATYSPAIVEVVDQCNIIVADGEDIIIKNELTEYTAYYDEIVGFNAGGQKIGMYADADCTELLAYVDSDFYMHAPHRSVVYLKAADETGKYIGITGQYSYIDEAGMQTVVFNGNTFNASSASEVGVIATVSSGLAYSDNFSLEGKANGVKGIVKAESTKQTSIGEFTVAIHSNFGAYTKVYAKPYMIINGTTYYGNVEYVNVAPLN